MANIPFSFSNDFLPYASNNFIISKRINKFVCYFIYFRIFHKLTIYFFFTYRYVLADPSLKSDAFGILLKEFLHLLEVSFLEKYVTKSKYHIVVGDHDDLKKDLKKKHK